MSAFAACASHNVSTCKTLSLLNIIPFPDNSTTTGWDKGYELIPAGRLAVKHINSNPDILPGYELEVIDVPSEACGVDVIVKAQSEYHQQLFPNKTVCVLAVVGLYCSTVTEAVIPIASYEKLPGHVQLAASSSPRHRNVTRYPYTFHAIASSESFNAAIIALMVKKNWTRINVIYGPDSLYFRTTTTSFIDMMKKEFTEENLAYSVIEFRTLPELFTLINRTETRIGYFAVSNSDMALILCEAYNRTFFLKRYTFLLQERNLREIISSSSNCEKDQMIEALESILLFQYKLDAESNSTLVANKTYNEYRKELKAEFKKFSMEKNVKTVESGDDLNQDRQDEDVLDVGNLYANIPYDQVWALAFAVNMSLHALNFTPITRETLSDIQWNRKTLVQNLKELESFEGASGPIKFDEKRQEVQAKVDIFTVRNGTSQLIGRYDGEGIKFEAGFSSQNLSKDSFDTHLMAIPAWLGLLIILFSMVLIFLTLFNTIVVLIFRKRPEVKSTSFVLTLIILIGCFFLLISPILQTIYMMVKTGNAHRIICFLEFWLSLDGIYMILTTLLVRLLRVFHVFRSHHSTGKFWADKYLLLYIALIFSPMLCITIIKVAVDPFYLDRSDKVFVSDDAMPRILLANNCTSKHTEIWLAISFSLIGVVMVLVTFLAVQTRHIKKKHFKDTKKINVFLFSTCIIYAIFVPLWLVLDTVGKDLTFYILKCAARLLIAALCQCFLFLPKTIPALLAAHRPTTPQTSLQGRFSYATMDITRKGTVVSLPTAMATRSARLSSQTTIGSTHEQAM